MSLTVRNQKPTVLSPVYQAPAAGQFDPLGALKSTVVTPLFNPLNPTVKADIKENGSSLDEDTILSHIANCCGDTVNAGEETWCRELFRQTMLNYDTSVSLAVQDLFASQSGAACHMYAPSPTVQYTPLGDLIPACKKYLAGAIGYDELFANFAYYTRVNLLGFYFSTETAFDDFKAWFQAETAKNAANYPAETNTMILDFVQNIKLDSLTEVLALRNNDSENNDENSFARVLIEMLMAYTQVVTNPSDVGVFPFALGELFCPLNVAFINIEKHAHAPAAKIKQEWDMVQQALSSNIKMISNGRLTSLTATQRHLKKIQGMAANASTNAMAMAARAANIRFRKTPPNQVDIVRYIKKIMQKMSVVARSENSYKSVKITYQKPNRRDPDDFNKPGRSVSVKYKPDIHVYIDTSGSISEENYEGAIKACIQLAKKLNINLYFNSFSHVLSQCTKLNTRDKSLAAIYREFQKTPKVTGGTDYEQIWHYINKSKKRRRELSLIITDFEWSPRTQYVQHPANLYYMPCAGIDWQDCVSSANYFAQSMLRNEPGIRKHILM